MGANRTIRLTGRGELRLYDGGTSLYTALKSAAALGASRTWVLPATDGAAGQALVTDGAGNLSFGFNPSTSLQSAYNGGNTITVTGGTPVELDLSTGGELLRLKAAVSGVPYLSVIAAAREGRFGADAAGSVFVGSQSAHSLQFRTGGTTRWTVDSSGNLSGGGTFASVAVSVTGTLATTSTNTLGGDTSVKGNLTAKGPSPWYDVMHADWGAVGDDTADDQAALQAAITAADAAGKGTIFLPPKVYKITTPLAIPITARNLTILGYGAQIHYTGAANYALTIGDLVTGNNRAEKIAILGVRFKGLGETDASNQSGIGIFACLDVVLRDVEVEHFPGIGIYGEKSGVAGSAFWNQVMLDHVKVRETGGEALKVGATGAAVDDITIVGPMFNNAGKKIAGAGAAGDGGVYIRAHSIAWHWGEVSAMGNDDGINGYINGAVIRKGTGVVNGVHFESNGNNQAGSADLFLDTDAEGLSIIGSHHSCDTATSAKVGIKIRSRDVTVIGAKHDTINAVHRFTYLVDAQGAVNPHVSGLTKLEAGGVDPATDWVLWNKTASTPDKLIGEIQGDFYCARIKAVTGTTPVAGDFALSGGFGSTSTISNISGNDTRLSFRINATGVGFLANPTCTFTFKNGTWTNAPFVLIQRTGGNQLTVVNTWTVSATQVVITFVGTAVAGETYDFVLVAIG